MVDGEEGGREKEQVANGVCRAEEQLCVESLPAGHQALGSFFSTKNEESWEEAQRLRVCTILGRT